jgi:hypothetical protein
MSQSTENRGLRWALVALVTILLAGVVVPPKARAADETDVRVLVTDAVTGKPIFQAHLTLQFTVSRRFRRDKSYSLSAKTDLKGMYRFRDIPKGTIRLLVIAKDHQTFGQEYEISEDHQLVHVKMKRPQPQV